MRKNKCFNAKRILSILLILGLINVMGYLYVVSGKEQTSNSQLEKNASIHLYKEYTRSDQLEKNTSIHSYKDIETLSLQQQIALKKFQYSGVRIGFVDQDPTYEQDIEEMRQTLERTWGEEFEKFFDVELIPSYYKNEAQAREDLRLGNIDFIFDKKREMDAHQNFVYSNNFYKNNLYVAYNKNNTSEFLPYDHRLDFYKNKIIFINRSMDLKEIFHGQNMGCEVIEYDSIESAIREVQQEQGIIIFTYEELNKVYNQGLNIESMGLDFRYNGVKLIGKAIQKDFIEIVNAYVKSHESVLETIKQEILCQQNKQVLRTGDILSEAEKNWLNTTEQINIKVMQYEYPFIYKDKFSKKLKGIAVDWLTTFSHIIDIPINYIDYTKEDFNSARALEGLKQNELYLDYRGKNDIARERFISPYKVYDDVVIIKNNSNAEALSNESQRIGIVEGSITFQSLKENTLYEYKMFSNLDQAIEALNNEEIEGIVGTKHLYYHLLNNEEYGVYIADTIGISSSIDLFIFDQESMLYNVLVKVTDNFINTFTIKESWSEKFIDLEVNKQIVYKQKFIWSTLIYKGNMILAGVLIFIIGGSIYYWIQIKKMSGELTDKNHLLYLMENDLQHVYMVIDLNKNRIKYASANINRFVCDDDFQKIKKDLTQHERLLQYMELEAYKTFIEAVQTAKAGQDHSVYIKMKNQESDKDMWINVYVYALEKHDIIISLQDVTQVYEQQVKLQDALEKTQVAEQTKTQFLANISHEMRTPMNAIIGLTEIGIKNSVKKGCMGCEQRLRNTERVSRHLLELINDLLDMEKVSSGKVTLNEEVVHLPNLVQDVLQIINQRIKEKNQELVLDINVAAYPYIIGDELRLKQVIINLLSNANKFTPEQGKITWEMQIESLNDDYIKLHIVIEDTGIGIENKDQEKIFSAFEQVGHRHIGAYEGTGLGLPITKDIVELMGGKIQVQSEVGKGSVFVVNVLLKKADQYDQERVSDKHHAASASKIKTEQVKRILLVDDVEINRMIVEELLSEYPYHIEMATNGMECVEKFEASHKGYYDIILMDIQMPLMNGYEATERIRGSSHPDAKDVIIIAMSANAYKEDIKQAEKSGMNDYISKPIYIETLVEKLKKY